MTTYDHHLQHKNQSSLIYICQLKSQGMICDDNDVKFIFLCQEPTHTRYLSIDFHLNFDLFRT